MSWDGSRKRRRSPAPGYDDEYRVLSYKQVELDIPIEEVEKVEGKETEESAVKAETSAEGDVSATTTGDGDAAEEKMTTTADGDAADGDAAEEKMESETADAVTKTEPVPAAEGEPMDDSSAPAGTTAETNGDAAAAASEEATSEAATTEEATTEEATTEEATTEEATTEEATTEEATAEEATTDATAAAETEAGDSASTEEAKASRSSPERKRAKKQANAQFLFNRQHLPSVVCRLNYDSKEQVRVMHTRRAVGAAFFRCILDESQEMLTQAEELRSRLRLGEKYRCDDFQVELITGRRQSSRSSHHHVTLPVHVYYLLRLYYFKDLRLQNSISGEVKSHLPAEHWGRYYEGRRRFLDDQATRARHYHREDDDLVNRYVRTYERAKENQKRKREDKIAAEAKAKREEEEKAKAEAEAEAKASEDGAEAEASEDGAEKAADADAEATEEQCKEKVKSEDAESSTGDEKQETTETTSTEQNNDDNATTTTTTTEAAVTDSEAADAQSDAAPAAEDADMDTAAPSSKTADEAEKSPEVEEVLEAQEVVYVEEGDVRIAKSNYPINEVVTSQIDGLDLDVVFDPDNLGIPACAITVRDFPAMRDASTEQLSQLLSALEKFCELLHLTSVCTLIARPGSSQITLVTDIASFMHRLDTSAIPVWAKSWREKREQRSSTSSRAVGESVESLESAEPAAIRLSEWSDY